MPKNSRRLRRLGLAAAIAAIATLAGPHAANAGTYTVSGTCGLWSPWNWDGSRIAVYAGCPALYARQTYGAFTTPAGVAGGWRFDAPWGTEIQSVTLEGALKGFNGWQAAAYTEGNSARTLVDCPGVTCPGGGGSFTTYPTYGAGFGRAASPVRSEQLQQQRRQQHALHHEREIHARRLGVSRRVDRRRVADLWRLEERHRKRRRGRFGQRRDPGNSRARRRCRPSRSRVATARGASSSRARTATSRSTSQRRTSPMARIPLPHRLSTRQGTSAGPTR